MCETNFLTHVILIMLLSTLILTTLNSKASGGLWDCIYLGVWPGIIMWLMRISFTAATQPYMLSVRSRLNFLMEVCILLDAA